MVLRDVISVVLDSDSDFTPSLPDPAAVPSRSHDLVNTGASLAVWTATGTLPFLVDGVASASLAVPRGARVQVQSDGARWVVINPAHPLGKSVRLTGVTNASGNAVFDLTAAGFTAAPIVSLALQTGSANSVETKVTALSATSCTVNVRSAPIVTVLAVSVLGAPGSLVGATVHLHAFAAGSAA